MKQTTSPVLVSESKRLTDELRQLQAEMARCGRARRDIWQELNDRGISQKRLALACGVVEHTVYTELRKRRETA
jgi:acetylglutamate kinase